jgi:hypothetical protein
LVASFFLRSSSAKTKVPLHQIPVIEQLVPAFPLHSFLPLLTKTFRVILGLFPFRFTLFFQKQPMRVRTGLFDCP